MPALPFDTRIDRAGHLIRITRCFFDVWWEYIGADTRPASIDVMNNFLEFFRIDEHAHLVSLVTHLAALFEARSDTINFKALVGEARRENLMPERSLVSATAALTSVSELRSKVSILRSNLFAHRSASLSYNAAFERAAITPFQLRDLTDAGCEIANILLSACGLPQVVFTSFTTEHTQAMLQTLGKCS